ncbi:MAG: gliding motility-associated-like protein [Crocinitomix sp.]|jgi:gliding motility-associated-like protein
MTTINKLKLTLAFLISFFITNVGAQTTFTYTGAIQTYTVPGGVTSVQVEVCGAQGQAITLEQYDESVGGAGGYAIGTLAVTPGEVLNIYVGGTGTEATPGWNGGAAGGWGTPSDGDAGPGGSGGGASDVRQGGTAYGDRVIVGGGGGGGGRDYVNGWCQPCGTGGNGGVGGSLVGGDGDDPFFDLGGFGLNPGAGGNGGTQVAGGLGGNGPEGPDGANGVIGVGAVGVPGNFSVGSGGGGGGYYGGGSGAGANWGSGVAAGGGAGGSSYIGGVTDASMTAGTCLDNGNVIITILCTGLTYTATSEEICEGEEITLDATSLGGGAITWDLGVVDGVPFTPVGVGVITYTATSDDPEDCELEVDILVNPNPEVTIAVDEIAICEGETVTFTQGGDADTYVWDPVDVIDGVPYTPASFGTILYTLTGTFDATGCETVATVDVTMYELPPVTAAVDFTEICLGEEVVFTGGGATSYVWDLGVTDGIPYEPGGLGTVTYTVTGTDDASGCVNTATIDVTVNDIPIVTASADAVEVCDGEMVTLTGGGAATYIWDLGVDDGVAFAPPIGTTTYTVIGETFSGCTAIATIDITVNPLPVVLATATEIIICEGDEITLTGSGADTYVWDLGVTDGVSFAPAGLGTITYTVIGSDDITGCENTASIDILIEAIPIVTATASATDICQGESVTLTGGGTDTYIWDGGATDGVAFTPGTTGTIDFIVTGTDATSGCQNTATVSVTVHETPLVEANATTTEVCIGESVTLTGSGADSYTWSGGIFDGVSFTPGALGSTTYTVTGTSAFGCTATATIDISVIDCEPVSPDFIMKNPLCIGDCITIMDASTGGTIESWDWDFGGAVDPSVSTDQNPVICVTTAGAYTVQLTTTSSTGATETAVQELIVNENPIMNAAADTIIDLSGAAVLVATTVSTGSFTWTPDQYVDCPTCQFTSADPRESTTYTVTLIDDNGCSAVDTVMVLVNFVEGVGVPTGFSPNGDGYNDVLFVKGLTLQAMHFVVYNRYGEAVFETTQQGIGWDGTFKNKDENPGVFTWVLHYEYLNGNTGVQKGNTTLVR